MRYIFDIFYDSVMCFVRDDGWAIASHIALSILTSMFPFLIFVTALGGFFGSGDLADEAVKLLFQTWPKQVAEPLAAEIHAVLTQTRGGLLTIGVLLSIYFSSSGVEALRVGLNRAYDVTEERRWWMLRLESIAFVLVGAVALLILALAVVFAPFVWTEARRIAPGLEPLNQLLNLSRFTIATIVIFLALVIVHKFLPAGRRSLWEIAPGIVLTFVLWAATAIIFGYYLAEFARNYVTTYAGLASVMIALVFLYMLAAIFIFGGEVNEAIVRIRRKQALAKAPSI
jgi:membrane protein